MKKLMYLLSVVFLAVAILSSCNKKEEKTVVKEKIAQPTALPAPQKAPALKPDLKVIAETPTPCKMIIECADPVVYKYCSSIDFPGHYVFIEKLNVYNYFRSVEKYVIFNEPGIIKEYEDGSFKYFRESGEEFPLQPGYKL